MLFVCTYTDHWSCLLLQKREHSGLQSVQCFFFFFPTDTLPNHLVQYGTGANLSISTCLHYHIIAQFVASLGLVPFTTLLSHSATVKLPPSWLVASLLLELELVGGSFGAYFDFLLHFP